MSSGQIYTCVYVLISKHLTEAEKSTQSKNEAEMRACFCMVSDCIHHTAAGTEFSHASALGVQESQYRRYCVIV